VDVVARHRCGRILLGGCFLRRQSLQQLLPVSELDQQGLNQAHCGQVVRSQLGQLRQLLRDLRLRLASLRDGVGQLVAALLQGLRHQDAQLQLRVPEEGDNRVLVGQGITLRLDVARQADHVTIQGAGEASDSNPVAGQLAVAMRLHQPLQVHVLLLEDRQVLVDLAAVDPLHTRTPQRPTASQAA